MGNVLPSLKPNTKKIAVLSSFVAFVLTVLFLAGVFKDKPKEVITSERKFEKFTDFVTQNPDGSYELKPERKRKLNADIKRMREGAEQYVLLAKEEGNYGCLHCPRGTFYLYKGEVVKVGITRQGEQGRYDQNYYDRMKIEYLVEYRGTLQGAAERELIRLGNYPLTPENLARPDEPQGGVDRYKLARPVQNALDN